MVGKNNLQLESAINEAMDNQKVFQELLTRAQEKIKEDFLKTTNRLEEKMENQKESVDNAISEILDQLKSLTTAMSNLTAKVEAPKIEVPKNLFSSQDARFSIGKSNPLLLTSGNINFGKAKAEQPSSKLPKSEPIDIEAPPITKQAFNTLNINLSNLLQRPKNKLPPSSHVSQENSNAAFNDQNTANLYRPAKRSKFQ